MTRKAALRQATQPKPSLQRMIEIQSFETNIGHSDNAQDDNAEDQEDDDDMVEMLTVLQELQRRKATKGSVSAEFQKQKTALFMEARKNVETIVRDGVAYIDQCKATITEVKAREVSRDEQLKDFMQLWTNIDDAAKELLDGYSGFLEDLAHRRAKQINETSEMLEIQGEERQMSRRRLIMNAKIRMDENLEKQKLATDATNLIKHFKGLLLS